MGEDVGEEATLIHTFHAWLETSRDKKDDSPC
jgi:hypothetical protein